LFKLKKRKPVPKKIDNPIRSAIGSVLSGPKIEALARELGVVQRQRKVRAAALVMAVVFGFAGAERSLAAMRRAYGRATGRALAPSAFYARFTEPLVRLLFRLVEDAMAELQAHSPKLKNALGRFQQVLAADGSLVRLRRGLAKKYPSVFPNKVGAAAKLHVVLNVAGRSAQSVKLRRGKDHDVTILKIGRWVQDKLLILDLAYRKGLLCKRIAEQHGYFLLRKKESDNPLLTEPRWHGLRLSEIQQLFVGKQIDVEAQVPWKLDRGPNKNRRHYLPVRIVGHWNDEERRHHFYVTNAPPSLMRAEHVGAIYAARWEIELFFRELKLVHRIEQIPSQNRFVAESLIYGALLSLLVSRRLRQQLLGTGRNFALERWARLFATFATELLNLAVGRTDNAADTGRLIRLLRREAVDPNRKRSNLLQRAELGRLRPCG
jgi:IS4 transposase